MTKHIELKTANQGTALATGTLALPPLVIEGLEEFKGSFDRLCLQAGTAAIEAMLAADAEQLCGKRYQRHADRQGHRWGMVGSEVGWHGGKAAIRRPRVRQHGRAELELPSWTAIQKADLLSRWAFNQMLIGVATRKYARSVRLPDGGFSPTEPSATFKRFNTLRSISRLGASSRNTSWSRNQSPCSCSYPAGRYRDQGGHKCQITTREACPSLNVRRRSGDRDNRRSAAPRSEPPRLSRCRPGRRRECACWCCTGRPSPRSWRPGWCLRPGDCLPSG